MAGSNDRPLVTLSNASFRLGDRLVFEHTCWCFRRSEQWLVSGPNGSGKSLFAEALKGTLPLVAGGLQYHFRPAAGLSHEESIVSVAFPDRQQLLNHAVAQSRWDSLEEEGALKVSEYLSYERVLEVNPYEITTRHDRARKGFGLRRNRAVKLLRLEPLLDRTLVTLSNGEFQRSQLARALCHPARLLILDEPFAGLDAGMRRHFAAVLQGVMREMHILLLTTMTAEAPRGITHMLALENCRVIHAGRTKVPCRTRQPPVVSGSIPELPPGQARKRDLIEFKNVTVSYGETTVLRELNWVVRVGESWAVLGPNGSGKTTLLSLILGDHPQAYSNDIHVFGHRRGEGTSIWDLKRRIGWVSPELHASFDLNATCFETVASGFHNTLGLFERPTRKERARSLRWLKRFGLEPRADAPLASLSVGLQRVALLARATVNDPPLLLLDEPCQGLDPAHRDQLLGMVDGLIRSGRTAVIYVSHTEVPSAICRVLHLPNGPGIEPTRVSSHSSRPQ